jgi:hypothetical protein
MDTNVHCCCLESMVKRGVRLGHYRQPSFKFCVAVLSIWIDSVHVARLKQCGRYQQDRSLGVGLRWCGCAMLLPRSLLESASGLTKVEHGSFDLAPFVTFPWG